MLLMGVALSTRGYITLFASAYPLAAAISVLANFAELRSDSIKLARVFQKPRVRPSAHCALESFAPSTGGNLRLFLVVAVDGWCCSCCCFIGIKIVLAVVARCFAKPPLVSGAT